MCQKDVQQVISRVAAYQDFRQLLAVNPQKALKNYDLTMEEKSALTDIASSRFSLDVDAKGNIQLVS